MDLQAYFKITVVAFTILSLLAMGLELELRSALRVLRNARSIALILFCGWVVGPALAWVIVKTVPLETGYAAGLLLISLAPTAPTYPLLVRRAGGDMSFAAAFLILTTFMTLLLLPVLTPVLIRGVSVDAWSLFKPLFVMALLPLLVGAAVRVGAPGIAKKLLPLFSKLGLIFMLLCLLLTAVLYSNAMVGTVGSYASGALFLFFVGITCISYAIGFDLPPTQRKSMAIGMCTRNIAAAFAVYFGIEDPPSGLVVMIVLVFPLSFIVSIATARLFANQTRSA